MRLFPRRKLKTSVRTEPDPESIAAEDRELDDILRIVRRISTVILLAGLLGALIGGFDWLLAGFSRFSLLALLATVAILTALLKRSLVAIDSWADAFFVVLLVGFLLLGFHVAQYELFLSAIGEEITNRMALDFIQVFPVQLPGMIDQILIRRTGVGGIVGFSLMRYQQSGLAYAGLWVARVGLSLAAAWVVAKRRSPIAPQKARFF